MGFSGYLNEKRDLLKALVAELRKTFAYVSVLGSDIKALRVVADRATSNISDGSDADTGFVVKMSNGGPFFEYSLDDVSGDMAALAEKIRKAVEIPAGLSAAGVTTDPIEDEPLIRDFVRETDFDCYTADDLLAAAIETKEEILRRDPALLNATCAFITQEISKIFVSEHRMLTQYYTWANGVIMCIASKDGKTVTPREAVDSSLLGQVCEKIGSKIDPLLNKAKNLLKATPIEPGVYDVITDPSITGLIAHEAFGHGLEMDQFVKHRAIAADYMGKYVASPIVSMRDGAAATFSVASYFFDDDGVLAQDTCLIRNGILVGGMSDLVSSRQLHLSPSGNGRRESHTHKAYTRMTNTFFEPGKDKLDDMIASIRHGYMLFETNNGMEDPKNWAIQCVCEYGIEIRDGKLTDHYVSPVVMSGYVPDLLKSISMISDDFRVIGAGSCGKGYKEWVRVSDGGPHLKAKVKLS